jgi:hypothetical protein
VSLQLPNPYEDELLYSTFARMFAYIKPSSQISANQALFGTQTAFPFGFGYNLNELAERTRHTWNLSADDLIRKMTLLPFYGYYLPYERYSKCLNTLKTGEGKSLLVSLGLVSAVTVSLGTSLRFCRSCALMDLAN